MGRPHCRPFASGRNRRSWTPRQRRTIGNPSIADQRERASRRACPSPRRTISRVLIRRHTATTNCTTVHSRSPALRGLETTCRLIDVLLPKEPMTLAMRAMRAARALPHALGIVGRPAGLVLLYHRIAVLDSDPQRLAVTPQHFARHLELLREYCHPMPLRELVEGVRDKTLPD